MPPLIYTTMNGKDGTKIASSAGIFSASRNQIKKTWSRKVQRSRRGQQNLAPPPSLRDYPKTTRTTTTSPPPSSTACGTAPRWSTSAVAVIACGLTNTQQRAKTVDDDVGPQKRRAMTAQDARIRMAKSARPLVSRWVSLCRALKSRVGPTRTHGPSS